VQERRFSVLGTWVHAVDPARTLEIVAQWIADRHRSYVCLANVHGVMEALRDPQLRRIYNAGLTVPDGMPLVWIGRSVGARVARVYGPDLLLAICAAAVRRGWSCYFYGGADGVADRLRAALSARYPGLAVAGVSTPPFYAADADAPASDVDAINAAKPDVVFVGLGCPKQERWMALHRAAIDAPVLVGVGAAFDFHAGLVRQAPIWMRSAGLEWLFRLIQEPRRLWRRYVFYNPMFVFHVVLQRLGLRRYAPNEPPP
jgi:N-acetylglucosaminyldiphosphoundecaprenol N-acetyl-beta-D-mannosaminyltransferase